MDYMENVMWIIWRMLRGLYGECYVDYMENVMGIISLHCMGNCMLHYMGIVLSNVWGRI